MEVKINSRFVIAEREKRAWSQQHLAEASGLALRTIQRIEAGGTGSYESAKAIASCLGIPVADLRTSDESQERHFVRSWPVKAAGSVVGASLLAGVAALFFGNVFAEQVLLDVSVTKEQEVLGETTEPDKDVRNYQTQLLLNDGDEKGMPLEGEFNLVIAPTILGDGKVVLSVRLYEYRGQGFELVGEPRVITPDGEETEVLFPVDEEPKRRYRVAIKPQIQ